MSVHHSFDVDIAAEYGIYEAVMIHHFQHWIRHNKALGQNFIDGRTWTYQTRKEIAAHYPYMSEPQVKRLLLKLVKKEVLMTANYNSTRFDRTKWFAFKDEEKFRINESSTPCTNSDNGSGEIGQPIPHTKTNTKKKIPKGISQKRASKISDQAVEWATRFHKSILSWKPGLTSKAKTWHKDFQKLINAKVTEKRFTAVINWLALGKDDNALWWRPKVLSGAKLLKQFDTLEGLMLSKPVDKYEERRQRKIEEEIDRELRGY